MPRARDPAAFPKYRLAPVGSLVAYANNPRTHSPAQIDKLVASIREFGFTNPVLTDGANGIVAGHGRVVAAQKLGMATVPTLELSHLSPAQRRAYVMADNRLAMDAGWDDDLLRLELGALRDDGFDLGLTGFDVAELAALFDKTAGLTDPDDVPETPAEPISRLGDVWIMGRHRLVCGDATSEVDMSLALAGVKPHLMVTDPPYGVEYDPDWRNDEKRKLAYRTQNTRYIQGDHEAKWEAAHLLFPGDVAYVWHADRHFLDVAQTLTKLGFEIRAQIIWAKEAITIGRGNYSFQHEPCFYAVRKGKMAHWAGPNNASTLWRINRIDDSPRTGHAAQKPVECMKRPIENNSSPGQAVYEPFSGSGTTIIAAEMTGRACHAIEISPAYVDVAVLRWQAFVGAEAVLEATGRTFAETLAERVKIAA